VVILDIGMVDQEFIDEVGVPVIWIDHHEPQAPERAHYFNPEKSGKPNSPTCAMCYQVVEQDVWIATVGAFNDHFIPEFAAEFRAKYPDLLSEKHTTIQQVRFETPVGVLARVFGYNLKGTTEGTRKGISALIKIEDPREILTQSTSRGKLLWKRYKVVYDEYILLREKADNQAPADDVWVYIYSPGKYSITTDLADELNYRIKSPIIILGREKDGEYRCSLRSKPGIPLRDILKKALVGVQGYGGGHMNSCGAAIKVVDFERFLATMKDELLRVNTSKNT
jgi:hypothetical protein